MSNDVQVGVGLRPPHYAGVLEDPPALDCFEVISENFLGLRSGGGGRPLEILEEVRALRPIRLHGVSMNLGSVDPLSETYLARLRVLADRFDPACVSDHLCWTGEGGENLHDLLPLPWTEEALDHLVPRVQHVQERLGRRLVLENPSSYVSYVHSTLTEWEFLGELADHLAAQDDVTLLAKRHRSARRQVRHGRPHSTLRVSPCRARRSAQCAPLPRPARARPG